MTAIEKKLAELKPLMGLMDAESMAKKEEIFAWIEANKTEADSETLSKFAEDGYKEVEQGIEALRTQINSDSYRLLPMAYIAEKYFGKTRQWLYQRINGYSVRGKVYSLNEEQKATFNLAIQDIAQQIGSLRLS